MAHDQRAEDIGAGGDLIVHDALVGVQLVIVTAHLVQRGDGLVARAVSVVHRRPVNGLLAVPDGELVGDGERLAVADDHAEDVVVGHPGAHPGVDTHAGETDLVARPLLVLERVRGELLLVRTPAHLGGRGAFLAEALDAPGVHELVHLLRLVGDLGVALGTMDDLHAERARQVVELLRADQLLEILRGAPLDLAVRDQALADVDQALLHEVRDEPGVGAMLDNRGRTRLTPAGDHAPQVHVAPVERLLRRMLVRAGRVGIPQLGRRVDVLHAVVVAPLEDLAGVDVPRQVDDEVAAAGVLREETTHVLARHAVAHEAHAFRRPARELRGTILEIHDRDVTGRHLEVLEKDRERALRDRAVTDEQDALVEFDHDFARRMIRGMCGHASKTDKSFPRRKRRARKTPRAVADLRRGPPSLRSRTRDS